MRRLGRIAQQYPFAVSVGVATAKTGGADLVVQRYVEKKKSIDWSRTISFSVFGFVFLGVAQWFIYVPGYRLVFKEMDKFCQQTIKQKLRNKAGLKDLAGQIFIAQFVAQPLMYLPTFYICKEVIMGDYEHLRPQDWKLASTVAMKKYAKTFWVDNIGMLSFWLPADIVIYSVPIWIRLPLSHTISFLWTAILSAYRGEYN